MKTGRTSPDHRIRRTPKEPGAPVAVRARRGLGRRKETRASARETRRRLEALRSGTRTFLADGVIVGRFRFHVPRSLWAGELSARHPRVRIEILNRSEVTPHVSVSDCWISGEPPGLWAHEIAHLSDVLKVESLSEMGHGSLYRVSFRNPPIVYFFRSLRAPIPFPIWVQSGLGGLEVVVRRSEFEALKRFARATDPAVQIESVRRGPLRSHLPELTAAQHTLLLEALRSGYFAVPRKLSLSELAHRLHRGRSGLSRAIAVIERKLLESALSPATIRP